MNRQPKEAVQPSKSDPFALVQICFVCVPLSLGYLDGQCTARVILLNAYAHTIQRISTHFEQISTGMADFGAYAHGLTLHQFSLVSH